MKTIESVKQEYYERANLLGSSNIRDGEVRFVATEDIHKGWSFIEQSIKESLESTKLEKVDKNKDNTEWMNITLKGFNLAVKNQQELIDKYLNKK